MFTKQTLLFAALTAVTSMSLASDAIYPSYESAKGYEQYCSGVGELQDAWNFYTCNCTSFSAYWLNKEVFVEMADGRDIPLFLIHKFDNQYFFRDLTAEQKSKLPSSVTGGKLAWGNAGRWGGLAQALGISIRDTPKADAIAWWSVGNIGGVGHVGVYRDSGSDNGRSKKLYWNYNYSPSLQFSENWVYDDGIGNSLQKPSAYIDFVAFEKSRVILSPSNHPELFQNDAVCKNVSPDWRVEQFRTKEGFFFPTMSLADAGSDAAIFYYGSGCIVQSSAPLGTIFAQSDGQIIVGGYGGVGTVATDPVVPDLPDFVTNKVWLTTPWQTETYQYGKPETVQMHAQFENIGTGTCSGAIEVHFYLSQGYEEDAHTEWKRVGTDQIECDNLKPGMTHSEEEGIDLWIETPEAGPHNIVAYIDHIKDNQNEGGAYPEEHESNNGSTEAVFEVTTDGQIVNRPNIDYIAHSFQFLQTPTYAGDQARFGGYIQNIGIHPSQVSIRSNYSVECPGTGRITLTDDGTDVAELTPGTNNWEQTDSPVTLPNATGTCTAYLCADYQNAWTETNEANNCAAFSFTLYPRPKPILNIIKFQDEVGCCTTNLGSRIKPDVWIQNTGSAAPSGQVVTMYQISSPVATGGAWWTIGYGASQPSELPPGTTDEDYMDGGGWQIPVNSAWKNQWHTVRACVNRDGGSPTCSGNDSIATYARFSKK